MKLSFEYTGNYISFTNKKPWKLKNRVFVAFPCTFTLWKCIFLNTKDLFIVRPAFHKLTQTNRKMLRRQSLNGTFCWQRDTELFWKRDPCWETNLAAQWFINFLLAVETRQILIIDSAFRVCQWPIVQHAAVSRVHDYRRSALLLLFTQSLYTLSLIHI